MSKYFALSEFDCGCGCRMPTPVRLRVQALATVLDVVREHLGKPVVVSSGYRCPAHNRAVGGARGSQHVLGCAADLKVAGYTGSQLAAVLGELIARGAIPDGGLGTYSTWAHYDLRGQRARWA